MYFQNKFLGWLADTFSSMHFLFTFSFFSIIICSTTLLGALKANTSIFANIDFPFQLVSRSRWRYRWNLWPSRKTRLPFLSSIQDRTVPYAAKGARRTCARNSSLPTEAAASSAACAAPSPRYALQVMKYEERWFQIVHWAFRSNLFALIIRVFCVSDVIFADATVGIQIFWNLY